MCYDKQMSKGLYIPSPKEEKVSFLTHLPGVLLGFCLTLALLFKPESNSFELFSYLIYGLTFMLIFGASAKYHSCSEGTLKQYYKKIDHACIYIFMAGCYTPFVVIKMLPTYQTYFLTTVWLIAFLGASYKMISSNENRFISVGFYITFGLMCFLAGDDLLGQLSQTSYWLLALGGGFYLTGVAFYLRNSLPYNHGIWHIFVLLGAISQFFAIYYI